MKTVAIQGIRGSYSEEAARKMLGASTNLIECNDFISTLGAVSSNCAECAILPLRNKIVGEVETVANLLKKSDLRILEEFDLQIHHVLAGTAKAEIDDVTTVLSHSEALKQCSVFLAQNRRFRQIAGGDTATSIRRIVSENSRENAAIGSERAALFYGAKILSYDVANDADNWTTFGLIGRQ